MFHFCWMPVLNFHIVKSVILLWLQYFVTCLRDTFPQWDHQTNGLCFLLSCNTFKSWFSGRHFVSVSPSITRVSFFFFCRPLSCTPLESCFRIPVLGHLHTSRKFLSLSLQFLIFMCLHVLCFFSVLRRNSVCNSAIKAQSHRIPCISSAQYCFFHESAIFYSLFLLSPLLSQDLFNYLISTITL